MSTATAIKYRNEDFMAINISNKTVQTAILIGKGREYEDRNDKKKKTGFEKKLI